MPSLCVLGGTSRFYLHLCYGCFTKELSTFNVHYTCPCKFCGFCGEIESVLTFPNSCSYATVFGDYRSLEDSLSHLRVGGVLCNDTVSCESYSAFVVDGWNMSTEEWWIDTDRGKPKSSGDKPDQMPLYPPRITHGLAWDQTHYLMFFWPCIII